MTQVRTKLDRKHFFLRVALYNEMDQYDNSTSGCEFSTSEQNCVILVKLLDYSGKLPSAPVKNKPNFAAWYVVTRERTEVTMMVLKCKLLYLILRAT